MLVGTPIGNLGDLAPRAVEALAGATVIAAEDTRRTRVLLSHAGVSLSSQRLVALHAHNEAEMSARLVDQMVAGARVAYVTDAGMPGISDPGERLVRAALARGLPVEAVPGPSAALTALVISGLPTARFVFEGFLPRKGAERAARLAALTAEERTAVIFESPRRLAATLADLAAALGPDRPVAVARELTKLFETVWRGPLGEAVTGGPEPRGEQVIVIGPAGPRPDPGDDEVAEALRTELERGASKRDAAAVVAKRLGVSRRRTYELASNIPASGPV
ncbi:MAG: 16S rRNA (cytidine(1402)-2'-O)-methyltransferase [Actinomycetota bacterium]|nr:16S rRNA (cytidine(1402)-2'-O)-methyltransferase [Actinomycetota bacterium]